MMFNLVETVAAKDTSQGTARLVTTLLETCVNKLGSVTDVLDEINERSERAKNNEPENGRIYIVEKARPVAYANYAVEKPDEVLAGECSVTTYTIATIEISL